MKTVRVVLCDDDADSLNTMEAHVRKLGRLKEAAVEVLRFSDGEALLDGYPAGTDFLFLDVEMPLRDGIDAAVVIREKDPVVVIVFMSRFEQYAVKGYSAGAWRYLLKPVNWEGFVREMEEPFVRVLERKEKALHVKNDRGVFSVLPGEIEYLEVNPKKNVMIHTRDDTVECYRSLKTVEEELALPNFYRCHNSFVVNFDYITRVEKDEILLRDGSRIPLSKHRRKDFMEQFMAYAGSFL